MNENMGLYAGGRLDVLSRPTTSCIFIQHFAALAADFDANDRLEMAPITGAQHRIACQFQRG